MIREGEAYMSVLVVVATVLGVGTLALLPILFAHLAR